MPKGLKQIRNFRQLNFGVMKALKLTIKSTEAVSNDMLHKVALKNKDFFSQLCLVRESDVGSERVRH